MNFNPLSTNNNQSQLSVGAASVEMSRAIAETQVKIHVAKSFPRDIISIKQAIKRECSEMSVADGAFYSFGRGSAMATGLSIRAAEMLARAYGNMDYGIIELSRTPVKRDQTGKIVEHGASEMMAFAWDLENNVKKELKFTVSAVRDSRGGASPLSTERDLYENNANMGARRLRNCILALIPTELQAIAENECKSTLSGGGDQKSLQKTSEAMIMAFNGVGVTNEMIENKIGHGIRSLNADDLKTLRGVWNAIKSGDKISDHFEIKSIESDKNKAAKDAVNTDADFDVMSV